MGWELPAQHLPLDGPCRKEWLAQDTRAPEIVIFSQTPTTCFSLQIWGKWLWSPFSGSQNPEVLNAGRTRQQNMTADLQA